MRPTVSLSHLALIVCSAALTSCTTTQPHIPPAATPIAQGDDQPEPPTPGIKPLTVEQEEQTAVISN